MKPSLSWTAAVALLGFIYWRNGHIIRNVVIPTPGLPRGYYAEGPHDERCKIVRDEPSNDMKFCEDAVFWERHDDSGAVRDKVLLLSCDPGRKGWNTVMGPLRDPAPRGALWLYDISATGARPQRVTLDGFPAAHDFHPLGLDVWPAQPGAHASSLFVVNHARNASTIEEFALGWAEPTRARWVRTLAGPELVAPNALALTGPASFYLTHDHRFTRRLPGVLGKTLPITESLLALPLGWAVHVDASDSTQGTHTTTVVPRVPFPNGVAVSPDGAQLALASTTLCEVQLYARDRVTQALTLHARVPTPFTPDNLGFDARGALIVAGHPHFPALVAVAADKPGVRSPSWVVEISPRNASASAGSESGEGHPAGEDDVWDADAPVPASRKVPQAPGYELRTLYQSDGSAFSSSSTALRDAETGVLYMTGLYEEGVMVCTP